MPESGQNKNNKQIDIDIPLPVTAEGYVYIIPEPRREGYMPSVPEFGYALSYIGVIKIFKKLKAEHFPQPYGHV